MSRPEQADLSTCWQIEGGGHGTGGHEIGAFFDFDGTLDRRLLRQAFVLDAIRLARSTADEVRRSWTASTCSEGARATPHGDRAEAGEGPAGGGP